MFGGYGGGGSSSTYTEDSQRSVGNTTFAHGLGVRPKKFGCKYVCATTDGGFAVGDAFEIPHVMIKHDGTDNKLTIWADATNVKIAIRGNPFVGSNPGGTGEFIPNNVNWRLVLWAEA